MQSVTENVFSCGSDLQSIGPASACPEHENLADDRTKFQRRVDGVDNAIDTPFFRKAFNMVDKRVTEFM